MKNTNAFAVVIYADSLDDCQTIRSLAELPEGLLPEIGLIFFINGRRDFRDDLQRLFADKSSNLDIVYEGLNRGIVYAYQKAISLAGDECRWLTLLDQDSVFDAAFVESLLECSRALTDERTVAFAPRIRTAGEVQVSAVLRRRIKRAAGLGIDFSDGIPISPSRLWWGKAELYERGKGYPTCINSMTTFRTAYLRQMASRFPVDFFLDGFDNWLFYQMHRQGLGFAIMEDVTVYHNISVANPVINSTYWARELMALINTARISFAFLPLALLRFSWRLVRVSWQARTLKYFNIAAMLRSYKNLKKDLYR